MNNSDILIEIFCKYLVIGGFNNTRTVLRHGNKLLRNVETIDVLSASEPIHFKIEISPSKCISLDLNEMNEFFSTKH